MSEGGEGERGGAGVMSEGGEEGVSPGITILLVVLLSIT